MKLFYLLTAVFFGSTLFLKSDFPDKSTATILDDKEAEPFSFNIESKKGIENVNENRLKITPLSNGLLQVKIYEHVFTLDPQKIKDRKFPVIDYQISYYEKKKRINYFKITIEKDTITLRVFKKDDFERDEFKKEKENFDKIEGLKKLENNLRLVNNPKGRDTQDVENTKETKEMIDGVAQKADEKIVEIGDQGKADKQDKSISSGKTDEATKSSNANKDTVKTGSTTNAQEQGMKFKEEKDGTIYEYNDVFEFSSITIEDKIGNEIIKSKVHFITRIRKKTFITYDESKRQLIEKKIEEKSDPIVILHYTKFYKEGIFVPIEVVQKEQDGVRVISFSYLDSKDTQIEIQLAISDLEKIWDEIDAKKKENQIKRLDSINVLEGSLKLKYPLFILNNNAVDYLIFSDENKNSNFVHNFATSIFNSCSSGFFRIKRNLKASSSKEFMDKIAQKLFIGDDSKANAKKDSSKKKEDSRKSQG